MSRKEQQIITDMASSLLCPRHPHQHLSIALSEQLFTVTWEQNKVVSADDIVGRLTVFAGIFR